MILRVQQQHCLLLCFHAASFFLYHDFIESWREQHLFFSLEFLLPFHLLQCPWCSWASVVTLSSVFLLDWPDESHDTVVLQEGESNNDLVDSFFLQSLHFLTKIWICFLPINQWIFAYVGWSNQFQFNLYHYIQPTISLQLLDPQSNQLTS